MTETYTCDVCGAAHRTPEAAFACERAHIIVEEVRPVYLKGNAHPNAITVVLEDGDQCTFYKDPKESWHME